MSSNSDKKRKSAAITGSNNSTGASNTGSSYHRYKSPSTPQNPKRGGPGILLTCETGREFKARREALQILQQDWHVATTSSKNLAAGTTTTTNNDPSKSSQHTTGGCTLDTEIAQLREQRLKSTSLSSPDSPFVIYETGCKGTVLILYQTSGSSPATPPLNSADTTDQQEHVRNNGDKVQVSLETKSNETKSANDSLESEDQNLYPWDPLEVVKRIVQDMSLKSPNYTSSRYISRMIPIQRTCYATIEDISAVVQSLLEPIVAAIQNNHGNLKVDNNSSSSSSTAPSTLLTSTTTFAIQEKRRFCNHMKRESLITAVGNMVDVVTKEKNSEQWKVHLSKPDYTIWIDICKTVAGISIIPDMQSLFPRNFNLVEHRISLNAENGSDTEPTV